MRKEIFNVLNILLTLVSTTIIGFTICFKFFHLEPLRILLNTENQTLQFNELELEKLDYYSYAFLGINAFVLVISMCSAISKNVNRKSCYLVLMVAVFLTAIIFLVILGLTVGMSFGSDTKRISAPDIDNKFRQMLSIQVDQLTIMFIVHIGIHLLLLITTGIITTVIYCNYEPVTEKETSGMARVTVVHSNQNNTNMLYNRGAPRGDPRTHTSESFCFAKYHGFQQAPSPVAHLAASQNNLDAVQERKLPTLPNQHFPPVHSTTKKSVFIRSAPNLNRMHSNPYSQPNPPPPKSTDESSAGDSNDLTDKSPLIRNKGERSTSNQNYSRRKMCASMTEDDLMMDRPTVDFVRPTGHFAKPSSRLSPNLRRSPIRSISEASAFVASLSQDNPPKIPPRPHERQKSGSNLSVSFDMKSTLKNPLDESIYEASSSIVNKVVCKSRLITVPEPSEADEDSMGYTKIKEEAAEHNEVPEIQDNICHV